MKNISEKVRDFLESYGLIDSKFPILIAFSGGFDSMCLLDIVSKLRNNVIAIHLNHGWRGAESDREEENCRQFCAERQIEFYTERLTSDVKKTETAAREARYTFFKKCAEKFNSNAVLTAHNANDNAETLIYRIAKGTGTKGLCGIAPQRGIFYRPLLDVKREEIEKYCKENNLKPNCDSSNENTLYKRNLIRKEIIPQMEKINPLAIDMINSLSQNASIDNELISEYLKTLDRPYATENFINYTKALQTRLVYNLFENGGIEIDKNKILRTINFIHENKGAKSGKTLAVAQNLYIFVNCHQIELIKTKEKQDLELKISEEGEYELGNKVFEIAKCTQKPDEFPADKDLTAYVDLSNYSGLTLRTRREGDIIKPLGSSGTQKLKKYLNEKKVPQYKKSELLFLASGKEILWAPSLGISDRIKVVTNPTHMLKLVIKEN